MSQVENTERLKAMAAAGNELWEAIQGLDHIADAATNAPYLIPNQRLVDAIDAFTQARADYVLGIN